MRLTMKLFAEKYKAHKLALILSLIAIAGTVFGIAILLLNSPGLPLFARKILRP